MVGLSVEPQSPSMVAGDGCRLRGVVRLGKVHVELRQHGVAVLRAPSAWCRRSCAWRARRRGLRRPARPYLEQLDLETSAPRRQAPLRPRAAGAQRHPEPARTCQRARRARGRQRIAAKDRALAHPQDIGRRRRTVKARARRRGASALARLEAALHLVDHVKPPFAPHQAIVAVARAQRLQGIPDFHLRLPMVSQNGGRDRDRTCDPYDVNVVLYR